jgi:hypothetical protein
MMNDPVETGDEYSTEQRRQRPQELSDDQRATFVALQAASIRGNCGREPDVYHCRYDKKGNRNHERNFAWQVDIHCAAPRKNITTVCAIIVLRESTVHASFANARR